MLKKCLISLTTVAFLCACNDSKITQNEEVKIILDWVPNTNHTGLYAAQKLGYFKDAGLKVTIINPPEGSTTQLIGAKGGELGISFQETLAKYFAAPNPLPVTAVAAILQHNSTGLISNKSANIKRFGDLANHTYATWDDLVEQAIVRYLVELDGAQFKQIKIIPYSWDVRAALKTQADAAWIYYGWDGVAMTYFKEPHNFIAIKDLNKRFDYYTPVIIANNTWLKEHPDTAKKALRAIAKGYTWAANHPEQAGQMMCDELPEMDCELIKKSQNYLSKQYIADAPYWGVIDPSRWGGFYEFLQDAKVIDKDISKMGFSNEYLAQ